MAVSQEFIDYILDQLSEFGDVYAKRMFGGVSFYLDGQIFGMIGGDVFRLKVGDANQGDFEKEGMTAFFPYGDERSMPYWEVPARILENKTDLATWAAKALDIARQKKKKR